MAGGIRRRCFTVEAYHRMGEDAAPQGYRTRAALVRADRLSPRAFPDVAVSVDDLI